MSADPPLSDLELALQLQREDLEVMKNRRKGKGREGEADDLALAIQLYEAELAASASLASDQAMCASIARAVKQDADLIGTILGQEQQAAQDRAFASRLSRRSSRATASATPGPAAPDTPDEELIARLEALYMSGSPDGHPAESSAWVASRPAPRTEQAPEQHPKIECIACGDSHPRSAVSRSPCSHDYCRDCLTNLFTASLSDESLFPPRCCNQPIPLDTCRAHLPTKLAGEFLAKKVEMETPNRTYCRQPTCSAFIPPQFIRGEVGTCVKCRTTTCVMCKGAAHKGDCPHDPAAQELMRVAAENGWQKCFRCRRLVELEHGCNHMTCHCGAQFCYVCGERWKTCVCAQWNEERLLARANAIVNRDANAQRLNQAGRANRVERERRNLMANHECDHYRWRTRGGPQTCEECYDVLPLYIYECVQCRIMACRRCRYNRL